jgi:hypothetical protein
MSCDVNFIYNAGAEQGRFMVPMNISRESKRFMNCRINMPLLRSLKWVPCVGGYRHGAPTELLKTVHVSNGRFSNVEAVKERRSKRQGIAAFISPIDLNPGLQLGTL